MEKHVNYFALQKACEQPGCPLCTIINERIDRYIDGMLFEHISDRTFRAQYRQAGGFCPVHSEKLLSYRDGLAVAILGRDILEDYLSDFNKKKIRKRKALCPACHEREKIEGDFLTFLSGTADSVLQDFFTKSEGLCVQHYAKMVQLVRKMPKWLSDFQEEKFISLNNRVVKFIDCSAWGRQDDFAKLSPEDKIVWKELASVLRGQVL